MCARYLSDQNKVLLIGESGTYGVPMTGSSIWIGQVTESSIDDAENLIEDRYLGTATRNRDSIDAGPRDVTGTLTYAPQNMLLTFYGIGSVYSSSGTISQHFATEIQTNVWQNPFASGTGQLNSPTSFTLEDSKQAAGTGRNFIRTIGGLVPNQTTISAAQGEKVNVAVDWIGQYLNHSSGTTISLTARTNRPYLWSDCSITSIGSVLDTVKDWELIINQNLEGAHYVNGSRVIASPLIGNREYTLNLTLDLDGDDAALLYNTLYKTTGSFNTVVDLNADVTATGSQHTIFTLSGCYITSMENPSTNEGVTESSVEIKPTSISAREWSSHVVSGLFTFW